MSKLTNEITQEQSNEVCHLINSNHAACVHALALHHIRSSNSMSYESKVSFAKMEMINLDKYTLTFVECGSDSMCMMKSAEILFNPPLVSVKDAPSRLLAEGEKAMSARWSWLYSEPVPFFVLVVMLVLGYVTLALEQDGLQFAIENNPWASKLLTWTFGSVRTFYSAVSRSFYLAVWLHLLEAFYVAFKLNTKLKLPSAASVKWFLLVSCVGYPITSKALEFTVIDDNQKMKKQS
ncbi:hypothetical protein HJC23_008408 [Cyclotella cryptica]|uniref:DUF2470 domain-containing protein n=1 Tax=Cyclotella cryptica TaxID=29204 RepID=A0ABD3PZ24_9STRA